VFLAKPAFKASFVAGYCLRPQGHRNGLIISWRKGWFLVQERAEKAHPCFAPLELRRTRNAQKMKK